MRRWLMGLPGMLLAFGMGTGKSKIAIDLISDISPQNVLIVCPLRVIAVWEQQLKLHATFEYALAALDERVKSTLAKAQRMRDTMAAARARRVPAIILINYESVWSPAVGTLALHSLWSLIVSDECHRLKQASGKLSRFMGRLSEHARYRLGLSGTPLPHDLLDAWGLYRFLDRRVFEPTYSEFKMHYAVWGGYQDRQPVAWIDQEDFHRRFYSIALRVTADQVLDLPAEMEQTLYCQLSPAARKNYEQLESSFITWLGAAGAEMTIPNALVKLLRLQQLTGGSLRDDTGAEHAVDSSKEDLVSDWLSDLAPGEPVVLFARFHADLDALTRACQRVGRTAVEVSGRSRHGIAHWQAGEADILLAQIQTAGEGQDFTRARYAGYFSLGFNLKDYLQSRARIRRPGQLRPVTYYHFLVRNSIDEIVLRALNARHNLIEDILKEYRRP
jgi:SNF2 family DNA or RNA helicase